MSSSKITSTEIMIRKVFKIIYITPIFLFINYVNAQTVFQTTIEKPEWSNTQTGDGIVENEFGEIFVLSTVDNMFYRKVRLVKLTEKGEVAWDTIYAFTPEDEFAPRMSIAHDGGVIIASTSFSYPVADQDGVQDILVWKINKMGEIIWQKIIPARSFHSIIATSDRNYIILGTCYSKTLDLQITKIDDGGNIIWQKIGDHPSISDDNPTKLIEIDGSVYVGGYSRPIFGVWYEGLLYQFNLNGSINWEKRFPSQNIYDKPRIQHLFKFNDQLYTTVWDPHKLQTFTFTVNGDFKEISDVINIDLKGLLVDKSCGFLDEITGIVAVTEKNFNFKKYNRLDSAAYYDVNFDAPIGGFREIIKSKNGGYIVLSSAWSGGAIFVSKTDCLGNWTYWNEACNPTILPNNINIRLSPNPVTALLLIEAAFDFYSINITNLAGQVITYANECKCNRQAINLDHLAAGFYQVQINGDEGSAFGNFVKL